ncbi:hypothetical protein ACM61V_08740 [Sphingomonas sp. TX0543]|uniref:hypothetical protein n=1 Tax=unclassified Sphingomonas TaxID=196159 RepID=UPI0020167D34|nr:hypothetical protein [Sphingomonas sp. 3P27F8]
MMIPAILLMMLQLAGSERPSANLPATEWSTLAELPLIRRTEPTPELSKFVRDEVAAGRCAVAVREPGGFSLHVELGVLVDRDGDVRKIMPRAIGCPTVEQYAVGLTSRMARANLAAPGADTWYRTSIDFAWSE